MSVDKLVDSTQLDADLASVANAIRTKGGTSAQLAFPADFVQAIEDIETGGGGRPTASENDVIFIDYDGHILYSYTAEEFGRLSAMPTPPTPPISTLTAGWNWSFEDAQAYVSKYKEHVIGAEYTEPNHKMYMVVDVPPNETVSISIRISNKAPSTGNSITVSWGDDSEEETESGIGRNVTKKYEHTYQNAGRYTIAVFASCYGHAWISDCGHGRSRIRLLTRVAEEGIGQWMACAIPIIHCSGASGTDGQMTRNCLQYGVVFPSGFQTTDVNSNWFQNMYYTLRYVSWPKGATGALRGYNYASCEALSKLCAPEESVNIFVQSLYNCKGLRKFSITQGVTSIASGAFKDCSGLQELHFYPTTPPPVANADAFSGLPTDCIIYIPAGSLSDYTSATNYPDPNTYTYVEE